VNRDGTANRLIEGHTVLVEGVAAAH
jgi:hypothetical protein